MGVVLAQVVEPALVHDENPSGDDGSPAESEEKEPYNYIYSHAYSERLNNGASNSNQIKYIRFLNAAEAV